MADQQKFAQLQPFALAGAGAIIGDTSITLKSFKTIDGVNLTMTDFGTIGDGTLEPGNGTLEESISFTGVVQNSNGTATLTGVKSCLFLDPYTEVSGLSKTHAGSTEFVISNTSAFYARIASKANDETITGKWTFPDDDTARARIGSDTDTAVAEAFVTLGQLSRQAIAGAANASTTVKGLVELATQAEVDAKTTTGGTGALLVPTPDTLRSTKLSDYVADTGTANTILLAPSPTISAYTAGQRFSFKVNVTNTTTTTANVNGVGAVTVKKQDGATNLAAGDLVAGQIVEIEYNATSGFFQLMTPVAVAPLLSTTQNTYGFFGDGSDGDVTISGNTTLTKDMNYNNLTINNGVSLNTAGYRVYVLGTLTNNNATTGITNNGGAASGVTAGAAGAAGTLLGGGIGAAAGLGAGAGGGGGGIVFVSARTVAVQGGIQSVGGAGSSATSNSNGTTTGTNGTTIANSLIQSGTGGAGGTANGQAGGTGGVITTSSKMSPKSIILLTMMLDGSTRLAGGAGGGSGGLGGNGAGGTGGGGGGQGGLVVFIYQTLTSAGTISVAGGTFGTGFNGGSVGVAGGSGLAISIQV